MLRKLLIGRNLLRSKLKFLSSLLAFSCRYLMELSLPGNYSKFVFSFFYFKGLLFDARILLEFQLWLTLLVCGMPWTILEAILTRLILWYVLFLWSIHVLSLKLMIWIIEISFWATSFNFGLLTLDVCCPWIRLRFFHLGLISIKLWRICIVIAFCFYLSKNKEVLDIIT